MRLNANPAAASKAFCVAQLSSGFGRRPARSIDSSLNMSSGKETSISCTDLPASCAPCGLLPLPQVRSAGDRPLSCFHSWIVSLSAPSARSMVTALRRALRALGPAELADRLETIDWRQLRFEHVIAMRSQLARCHSVPAANLSLVAVRSIARMAWQRGELSVDDFRRIEAVRGLRREDEAGVGRAATTAERVRLFLSLERLPTPRRQRDAVLLAFGLVFGLRRAEIASVRLEDLDLVELRLRVRGKGGRLRVLPIPSSVRHLLESWVVQLPPQAEFLFPAINKAGLIQPGHVGPFAVAKIVGRICSDAGIRDLRTHDLRRTAITSWLSEGGADIVTAAKLSGHRSPSMVALYDRRDETRQAAALERIIVPGSVHP